MAPKIMTVVGARPQFIKAAPVSQALSLVADEIIINTGQHYDETMARTFFSELRIPEPAVDLGIGSGDHGAQTGRMLEALETQMQKHQPDVVQVFGDTNSTLAGALAAAKLAIPIAHVEAGLRSWRRDMPEEINRVITDHLSSALLCPTDTAAVNLRNEGITEGVEVIGDVMVDAAHSVSEQLTVDRLARLGVERPYISATVHRPANVDTTDRLQAVLEVFRRMPLPVAIAVHPRTAAAMERFDLSWPANVIALEPLGYVDMLSLVKFADAMLTDSGGLQKETIIVGTPCIVLRDETEWVETVEQGMTRLVGLDSNKAVAAVAEMTSPDPDAVDALFVAGAAARVATSVVALAG